MSPTHPFRTSRRSPLDDNGPNSAALRRSLASLQTHDRDTPLARRSLGEGGSPPALAPPPARASVDIRTQSASVEIRHISEKIRRPTVEILMQEIPRRTEQEYAPQKTLATEPFPETHPETIQIAQAQIPQPEETEAPKTENREMENRETEDLDEDDEMEAPENDLETDLADTEEAKVEAAETRAAQSPPRSDLLDARRFPKHYPADAADPGRHERLCSICHHPDRDAIEEAFLQWQRACDIFREFKLPSRTTIYRHAHAVGLFEQRARALRFVLENIMEESSACAPSADSIIRAVRAYSCLDDRGRWIEPPRHLIISREPFSAPPLPPGREITVEPSGTTEK
jgi:hypothetical protein